MRKTARDRGLSDHETGAPVALAVGETAPSTAGVAKQEAKKEGELTTARRLYPTVALHDATVTADALHCERQTRRQIVEAGGDYLVQLKANQPQALAHARQIAASADVPDSGLSEMTQLVSNQAPAEFRVHIIATNM